MLHHLALLQQSSHQISILMHRCSKFQLLLPNQMYKIAKHFIQYLNLRFKLSHSHSSLTNNTKLLNTNRLLFILSNSINKLDRITKTTIMFKINLNSLFSSTTVISTRINQNNNSNQISNQTNLSLSFHNGTNSNRSLFKLRLSKLR